jgi:hypothetical protein
MRGEIIVKSSRLCRSTVACGLLAAFFLALALVVAPQLHERIHKEAAASQHECAVTLIASGKYQQSDAPALVSALRPTVQFSKLSALNPILVPAPFLGASIFEHAPPVIS